MVHVTGEHHAECLLRSEARLGLAQRIAKIGNWEWHPSTGRLRRLLNSVG